MKLKVWIGITFASLMIVAAGAQGLPHGGQEGTATGTSNAPDVQAATDPIGPLIVKYAEVDPIDPWMPRYDG